ncbi:VF530 family DNA-binding protein [Shewanella sp. NIFS-20-20]|uniref:VF530 family protein n=1 Tax=Shewanella sp. NIFS-20-20 TaxID=2853806 RepID=UPI001C44F52A|nr:VF530 family DNA-binding protein [Shewanella sp. NIFS-20-20]MBV7317305.1 VF530 family DNA-binding protein [Shewanella sp. NIFS-20-20]
MIELQQNNPLHGLKLEVLLTEVVDFYGWPILYAALKLQCFKTNPSIESSVKFLKKTEWAREKLENFYLYRFKRMPRPTAAQYVLKPRERGFMDGVIPKPALPLTLEKIAEMQAKAEADYQANGRNKVYPGKQSRQGHKPNAGASRSGAGRQRAERQDSSASSGNDNNPWGRH